MKSKTTAGVLALFLGGLGVHKFYLGRGAAGILYLLFCWTFIPAIIAFFEAIILFTMSDADFNLKYNAGLMLAQAAPQNIVVNVANSASAHGGGHDLAAKLRGLQDLKASGMLTEVEFEEQKARALAGAQ